VCEEVVQAKEVSEQLCPAEIPLLEKWTFYKTSIQGHKEKI